MRYSLFCLLITFLSGQSYAQWIEKDSIQAIEEFIELSDWIYIDNGGYEMDCSPPFNSSGFKTTYYKSSDRSDLVFCKYENLSTGNYNLMFFRLHIDDQNRLCWKRDLLGLRFSKDNVLLETFFFDEKGDVCEPQEFTISVK